MLEKSAGYRGSLKRNTGGTHTGIPNTFTIASSGSSKAASSEVSSGNEDFRGVMRGGKRTFFFRKKSGPGRMAETTRAGTGDSACRLGS